DEHVPAKRIRIEVEPHRVHLLVLTTDHHHAATAVRQRLHIDPGQVDAVEPDADCFDDAVRIDLHAPAPAVGHVTRPLARDDAQVPLAAGTAHRELHLVARPKAQ